MNILSEKCSAWDLNQGVQFSMSPALSTGPLGHYMKTSPGHFTYTCNYSYSAQWCLLNIVAQWMLNHWLSDPGWHGLQFRVAFVEVQAGSWGGVEDPWRLSSSKRVNVVNELGGRTKPSRNLYPTERTSLSFYKGNEELQPMPAWSTKSLV